MSIYRLDTETEGSVVFINLRVLCLYIGYILRRRDLWYS